MKRLTEEMVIARTKISDLSTIKRLNCWGSELTDVSLLRRMSNVEVLALSINKISSLADFQNCRNLQELYVRQNSIKDLNEVCYLQNLPNLKNLWLGENPCAEGDGYRLTVLRALPRLQKLDDVAVSPEEMSEASKRGKILIHPEEEDASTGQQGETWNSRSHSQRTSPEISPTRCEESPPRRYEPEQKQNYSPDPDTGPAYYEDRRNANNYEQESPRQSRHYQYDDYTNGDRYHTTQYQQSSAYRQNEGSDGSNYSHSGYEQPHPPRQRDPRERSERCERPACPSNHRPPFHRRPVTRNSNILSAVLCLVKELDYPSLEVVEMAVRCRMDELED